MAAGITSSLSPAPLAGPFLVQTIDVPVAAESARSVTASARSILDRKVTPFDLTTRGTLSFNLTTGSYFADMEITNGVSYDTDKIKEILQGNVSLPNINPIKAATAFFGVTATDSSNYSSLRSQYYRKYGAENVYFVSPRFSDWASPEKLGAELGKAIVTAGSSAASSIKEAFNQIKLELSDVYSWARQKSSKEASRVFADVLESIVTGKPLDNSYLSVKWFSVDHTYRANVSAYGIGGGVSTRVPHLGFAVIWKTKAGALDRALRNFSSNNKLDTNIINTLLTDALNSSRFGSNPTLTRFLQLATSNPADALDRQLSSSLRSAIGLDLGTLRKQYVKGNPVIDLTDTRVGQGLKSMLGQLALGNEGSASVKKLEFNLMTMAFQIDVSLRHRHSWGSVSEILAAIEKQVGAWATRAGDKVSQELDSAGNALREATYRSGRKLKEFLYDSGARLRATYQNGIKQLEQVILLPGVSYNTASISKDMSRLFGTSPSKITQAMASAGVPAERIAAGLSNGLKQSMNTIAQLLWNSSATDNLDDVARAIRNGIGGKYADMARALDRLPRISASDVAGALSRGANLNMGQVARALSDGGVATRLSDVASALGRGIGGKYADMAAALDSISGTDYREVASALSSGLKLNMGQVARALWAGNAVANLDQAAEALARGIGGKYADMAAALDSISGITSLHVAGALSRGIKLNMSQVARALWDSAIVANLDQAATALARGIGGKYADMAAALDNIPGISARDVAGSMSRGIQLSMNQVARALWSGGVVGNLDQAADALARGIGGRYADMANALKSIPGISIQNVALSMKRGIGLSLNSITSAIWHSGIGGFNLGDLAYDLWHSGIGGFDLSDLAKALWNVGGVSISTVASSLWHSGIGGFNLGQLASIIADAFDMSWASAWSIVGGF